LDPGLELPLLADPGRKRVAEIDPELTYTGSVIETHHSLDEDQVRLSLPE